MYFYDISAPMQLCIIVIFDYWYGHTIKLPHPLKKKIKNPTPFLFVLIYNLFKLDSYRIIKHLDLGL